MNTIGQRERAAQNRIVALFRDVLGHDYLGDWSETPDNRNLVEFWLRRWR